MGRKNRRKKYISHKKVNEQERKASARRTLIVLSLLVLIILAAVIILFLSDKKDADSKLELYRQKADLLKTELFSGKRNDELSEIKLDGIPGCVVFISVSDSQSRASVFTGTGNTLESAWSDAQKQAEDYIKDSAKEPLWVKVDLMSSAHSCSTEGFSTELSAWRHEFFRSGISFDRSFNTALLEAELNGAKILDYDNECVDLQYLNNYLKKADRDKLKSLPDDYIVFDCISWFCDENSDVFELISENGNYGRRKIDLIDKEYVAELIRNASGFLIDQVNNDGSFIYGYYPRFDNEIDNYNIVRHASTLWSIICQYRMTQNEELKPTIDKAIDYMINTAIIYSDDDTAYLYEEKSDEIKLGGLGIAVVALTEYMDCFGSDKYTDISEKLGNGILTMFDENNGSYYHVLNGDFTRKEEFRTVYYDGEATFALCRLYSLTKDECWLDAAKQAVEYFIENDYVVYKDHWISYALNEITKYCDDERYYTFALRNANENLDAIYFRDTTFHTYLELLMSTFELYDRMTEKNIHPDYLDTDFNLEYLLETIYKRADHQLNGYFYPEYAMYMQNPSRILNTFMVRHDGYRVRIDDVQHNIGGYYLYYKNYDKLVAYGMLDYRS